MSGQFTRLPTDNSNSIRINPYKHKKAYEKNYAFLYNDEVYLTPKKPVVFKYIDTVLFKFELLPTGVEISRRMADSFRLLELDTKVKIYSKNKKQEYHSGNTELYFRKLYTYRMNHIGEYQSRDVPFNIDFQIGHVCVELGIFVIDAQYTDMYKLTKELPAYGYTWIRCIGGQIRVHKKTLSHHIPYFKQLFTQYNKETNYRIDVQLMDLCELIYYLPPFNRPITTGLTYGSIYRLAEHFMCLKLTDIHEKFILSVLAVAPVNSSFIAFEGGIDEYSFEFRRASKDKKKKRKERLIRKFDNELNQMSKLYIQWHYPELYEREYNIEKPLVDNIRQL